MKLFTESYDTNQRSLLYKTLMHSFCKSLYYNDLLKAHFTTLSCNSFVKHHTTWQPVSDPLFILIFLERQMFTSFVRKIAGKLTITGKLRGWNLYAKPEYEFWLGLMVKILLVDKLWLCFVCRSWYNYR